jgi:predicted hydrolase (HD superfamily)
MMLNREEVRKLVDTYVQNDNLRHHCAMVASAMEACARNRKLDEDAAHNWWTAGMLHDLDWEKYPDEHPNYALENIFPKYDLPDEVICAIRAHAPERTGFRPETTIERYLFACDELSGFMHAVSLMRPNGFSDMSPKSVLKKLKDKRFAENVSREDIRNGANLINSELTDHVAFLIDVFKVHTGSG